MLLIAGMGSAQSPLVEAQTGQGDKLALKGADVVYEDPSPDKTSKWFILPAMINVYPKLKSEDPIYQFFDPAMRMFAPGFDNVRTVGTLRDEGILWTPDFSIGRVLSRHWAAYVHLGYNGGKVRTKEDDTSIFLVPLHTDFEIFRSAAYIGLCADWFPWGMPDHQKEFHGFWDHIAQAKPSVGLRLTENFAGFKAKAKAEFPLYRFVTVELKDEWRVTSFNANIGVDIPIDNDDALVLNAGYNFAFSRSFDFDAAAYTIGWKRYF